MAPGLTASQTIGPFFHDALLREDAWRNVLVGPETAGERIRIAGHVYDGGGDPVPDAMVEIWQANAQGLLNHVVTRLYFEDEAANETDPILRRVPKERRDTLLAKRWPSDRKVAYQFDIVLQGKRETVFFDL